MVRVVVSVVALVAFSRVVVAQEPRAYVGGAFNFVTQTHSNEEPLGGTTPGGSAFFGIRVSPRLAIEFEPSFGGAYSWEYTYIANASGFSAHVIASRRDAFFPVQARVRVGVLEPVVGVGFVHGRISRHATWSRDGRAYFDDSRSDTDPALVAGLDAALKLTPRVCVVPTLRMLVLRRGPRSLGDPLGAQTSTGSFVFRYGIGARVAF
jgi:hypothetical protein